ncbi:IS66 family insertion sequence element accessory protein TnpA [Porticoccus sp.]
MTQEERAHFWQEQITDWQTSGLSGQAFCKRQNLVYHRFVYWRSKHSRTRSGQSASTTGFVSVTQAPPAHSDHALTLALPNGLSITGIHAGNVELLGSILRQL